jgi:hypothetical protein
VVLEERTPEYATAEMVWEECTPERTTAEVV